MNFRKAITALALAFSVFAAVADSGIQTNSGLHGSGSIPSQALSHLLSTFPPDFPVYGAQIYPLYDGSTELALLTTAEKDGWQIRIYSYGKTGQFTSTWQSDPFPSEFAVSSSGNFRRASADPLHDGTDVEFSGCKAHDCPGSFGVLIYSPSRRRAFQAVVRKGETIFSPELNTPENKSLKDYLQRKIEAMSHYHE